MLQGQAGQVEHAVHQVGGDGRTTADQVVGAQHQQRVGPGSPHFVKGTPELGAGLTVGTDGHQRLGQCIGRGLSLGSDLTAVDCLGQLRVNLVSKGFLDGLGLFGFQLLFDLGVDVDLLAALGPDRRLRDLRITDVAVGWDVVIPGDLHLQTQLAPRTGHPHHGLVRSPAGLCSSHQTSQSLGLVEAIKVGAVQPQSRFLRSLHLLLVGIGHGPVESALLVLVEPLGQGLKASHDRLTVFTVTGKPVLVETTDLIGAEDRDAGFSGPIRQHLGHGVQAIDQVLPLGGVDRLARW